MRHALYLTAALAALAALSGTPAHADEGWVSNLGQVIYEDEIGEYAVFLHYDRASRAPHRSYIRGLAGNFENRGSFTGYWTEPDGQSTTPECEVAILDERGTPTRHWGRLDVQFLQPSFPGNWDARFGYCFDAPAQSWNGRLDDAADFSNFGPDGKN